MDEIPVGLQVPRVAFYRIVKVGLHLEQNTEIRVERVERLVGFMVSCEYYFEVQRNGLWRQASSSPDAQTLACFFDVHTLAEQSSFEPVIGYRAPQQLDRADYQVSPVRLQK